MQAEDGTIKLGHSKDPDKRSREVGKPVEVAHVTEVLGQAERIERLAHRVLALQAEHVGGEWFLATLEEAVEAIAVATRQADSQELELGGVLKHHTREQPGRRPILVKLPPSLVEAVDGYCAQQAARPTRTAVIEAAIAKFLSDGEAKAGTRGRAR